MCSGLFCDKVQFFYPTALNTRQLVIDDITHCFKHGQSALVIGPTGSGKSTLLYLLAGLKRPNSGQILAAGRPISRYTSRHLDLWRRKVGLVFQEPHLFADMTALENVVAPLVPLRLTRLTASQRAMSLFEQLDLIHLAGRKVKHLSGGERQRVTLARALIVRPDYLFADEPTAFQDDLHASVILTRLQSVQNNGACVVVCSHDERLVNAKEFSEILKLNQGRLEIFNSCGTPF